MLKRLATVIYLLPPASKEIFTKLTALFVKVTQLSDVNKMTATNLAVVFSTTFLRLNCEDISKMLAFSEAANKVVTLSILHYDTLILVCT